MRYHRISEITYDQKHDKWWNSETANKNEVTGTQRHRG